MTNIVGLSPILVILYYFIHLNSLNGQRVVLAALWLLLVYIVQHHFAIEGINNWWTITTYFLFFPLIVTAGLNQHIINPTRRKINIILALSILVVGLIINGVFLSFRDYQSISLLSGMVVMAIAVVGLIDVFHRDYTIDILDLPIFWFATAFLLNNAMLLLLGLMFVTLHDLNENLMIIQPIAQLLWVFLVIIGLNKCRKIKIQS